LRALRLCRTPKTGRNQPNRSSAVPPYMPICQNEIAAASALSAALKPSASRGLASARSLEQTIATSTQPAFPPEVLSQPAGWKVDTRIDEGQ
jgi:hypothetical protein